MKKHLQYIFITIFFLLLGVSLCLQITSCVQKRLKTEIDELSQKVTAIHETLCLRKQLQDEAFNAPDSQDLTIVQNVGKKIRELDEKLEKDLEDVENAITAAHNPIAKLSVLPKFAELLFVMDHRIEAGDYLTSGIKAVANVQDEKIKTALYISFAESALRCHDFTTYEIARKAAEDIINVAQDSKWKMEMQETIENLATLEEECRTAPERNFLPILKDLPVDASTPAEELPEDSGMSHAGAPNLPIQDETPEDLEIGENALMPLTLEELSASESQTVPAETTPAETTPAETAPTETAPTEVPAL